MANKQRTDSKSLAITEMQRNNSENNLHFRLSSSQKMKLKELTKMGRNYNL